MAAARTPDDEPLAADTPRGEAPRTVRPVTPAIGR